MLLVILAVSAFCYIAIFLKKKDFGGTQERVWNMNKKLLSKNTGFYSNLATSVIKCSVVFRFTCCLLE